MDFIDVIGIVVLLGAPLAVFIRAQWRRDERDRERRGEQDPPGRSKDSYWGGMGRPGR